MIGAVRKLMVDQSRTKEIEHRHLPRHRGYNSTISKLLQEKKREKRRK